MAIQPFLRLNGVYMQDTLTNQHDYIYSIKLTYDTKCCTELLHVKAWTVAMQK